MKLKILWWIYTLFLSLYMTQNKHLFLNIFLRQAEFIRISESKLLHDRNFIKVGEKNLTVSHKRPDLNLAKN